MGVCNNGDVDDESSVESLVKRTVKKKKNWGLLNQGHPNQPRSPTYLTLLLLRTPPLRPRGIYCVISELSIPFPTSGPILQPSFLGPRALCASTLFPPVLPFGSVQGLFPPGTRNCDLNRGGGQVKRFPGGRRQSACPISPERSWAGETLCRE